MRISHVRTLCSRERRCTALRSWQQMFIQDFYETIAAPDSEGIFLLEIALHSGLTMRWLELLLSLTQGDFATW